MCSPDIHLKMENTMYVLHKKDEDESSVWHFYLTAKDGKTAQCKRCKQVLKTAGGSTKGLHTHLTAKHGTKLLTNTRDGKSNSALPSVAPTSQGEQSSPSSTIKRKVNEYFPVIERKTDTLDVSRMTSVDGLPFSIFVTSNDLRGLLKTKGYTDLPENSTTIRNRVVKYSQQIRGQINEEIKHFKHSGERSSLTFDEWTSSSNKRFMNINVHANKKFWNLGMVRIKESMTAQVCVRVLSDRLKQHGISLHSDIVAIVTDGPNVMLKVGKLVDTEHQICIAHGIHLAVCDVLYKKKPQPQVEVSRQEEEEDKDMVCDYDGESDEEDIDNFDMPGSDTGLLLASEEDVGSAPNKDIGELSDVYFNNVVKKVRKVALLFKRSPTKNDTVLQEYVRAEKGKELSLLLDVKTRWNSLLTMLSRFVELKTCIQKALIGLKNPIVVNDVEFDLLADAVSVLSPVKLTVEATCRRDANLCTADAALKFLLSQLEGNVSLFAQDMKSALLNRIEQRRQTKLSGVLSYLQNPKKQAERDTESVKKVFGVPSQQVVRSRIRDLLQRLLNSNVTETENDHRDDDDSQEIETLGEPSTSKKIKTHPLTLKEQLQKEIEESMTSPEKTTKTPSADLLCVLRKEMSLFENGGTRGHHLELVYKYLLTIPPSSVEPERVFSASGYLCNKLRSRLGDDTLDALLFLRAHFQQKP